MGGTWTSEDVGRVLWIISIFSANNKELNLIKNLNQDLNENKIVNKKLKRINEEETLIETNEKDEKDEKNEKDEKDEKIVISNKNKKIKK